MSGAERLRTVLGRLAQTGTVPGIRLAYAAQCGDSKPIAAQQSLARLRAAGVAPRGFAGLVGTSEGDDLSKFNVKERDA